MRRSILLFPKFDNAELIERIRSEHDPLYGLISPRITLVFPFVDDIDNNALEDIVIRCTKGISPFKLVMQGITANGNYLFLNVKSGNDNIIEIKDTLYSHLPFEYNRQYTYIPHITLGNTENINSALASTDDFNYTFETTIDRVCIETIDGEEKSHILFQIILD